MAQRRHILDRFRKGLAHAFSLKAPPLSDQDRGLLVRLAGAVARRQMTTPALLFLRSVKPLGSVGSQAMAFFRPLTVEFVRREDYDRLVAILDRRDGIDALIEAIESADVPGKDDPK